MFYSNIMLTGHVPTAMKSSKILALLKSGKPNDHADSFRPIALLSVVYKVLERLIYNRIESTVNNFIPVEQAGFRSGRSCTDQVLALTTYIKSGFQAKIKT